MARHKRCPSKRLRLEMGHPIWFKTTGRRSAEVKVTYREMILGIYSLAELERRAEENDGEDFRYDRDYIVLSGRDFDKMACWLSAKLVERARAVKVQPSRRGRLSSLAS